MSGESFDISFPSPSGDLPHIEHPDDWNMHEMPFAKQCSQLAYRLIDLSDRSRDLRAAPEVLKILQRISDDVRSIGS